MSTVISRHLALVAFVAAGFALFACAASAQEHFLAKGGKAEAVIVVGPGGDSFDRWVAGELQRYLKKLSGAEFLIVTSDKAPAENTLLVLGGPKTNPLTAAAQTQNLVDFAGLKPDGFDAEDGATWTAARRSWSAATTRRARCTPPTSCWSGWGSCFN